MKIWILSEKRTGSSYLCEILNSTGLFEEEFKEWYVKFDHKKEITNFYKKNHLPKYCKIHHSVMKKNFGSFEELINQIGECKFIHIKRKNIKKMIVSQILASKTNMYEIRKKEDYNKWIKTKIKIEKKDISLAYQKVLKKQKNWPEELGKLKNKEFISVYYENLIENPIKEIQEIFKFIEIPIEEKIILSSLENSNKKIIKQKHPLTTYLLKKMIKNI